VIGDSYILSILRNKKEPEYIEELSIRMEFKRYKAEQKTLSEYDEIEIYKTLSLGLKKSTTNIKFLLKWLPVSIPQCAPAAAKK